MSTVPANRIKKVQFYENHITPWTDNSLAIGLSEKEVGDITANTQAARAAYDQQQAAKQAAKAATEAYYNAVEAMGTTGAAVMKQIRAKAESTGDDNVYVLAQIPAPAQPVPKAPPGTPMDLKVEIGGNGALTLAWKCPNPAGTSGTIYQIYRSIGRSTEFTYLGGAGKRTFIDTTIPAGATQLTYQIQGVRSSAIGPWASFNVLFGTNAGGAQEARVEESLKIAA